MMSGASAFRAFIAKSFPRRDTYHNAEKPAKSPALFLPEEPLLVVAAGLEGYDPRTPRLVHAEELFHFFLRAVETLLRRDRQLHPFFEEAHRVLEREIALLEGLHDLRETRDGLLERRGVNALRSRARFRGGGRIGGAHFFPASYAVTLGAR
jgi:hypothetical protein